jgi:hypothetical protein
MKSKKEIGKRALKKRRERKVCFFLTFCPLSSIIDSAERIELFISDVM